MAEEYETGLVGRFSNWVTRAEDFRVHTNDVAKQADKITSYWSLLVQKWDQPSVTFAQASAEIEAAIANDDALGGRVVSEASPNLARNYFLASYWIQRAGIKVGSHALVQAGVPLYNEGVQILNEKGNEYEDSAGVRFAWDSVYLTLENHLAEYPEDGPALNSIYTRMDRLRDVGAQREDSTFTNEQTVTGGDIVAGGVAGTVDDFKDSGSKTWDVISGLLTGKRPAWMPVGQWLTLRFSVYGVAGLYVVGKVTPIVRAFHPRKICSSSQTFHALPSFQTQKIG